MPRRKGYAYPEFYTGKGVHAFVSIDWLSAAKGRQELGELRSDDFWGRSRAAVRIVF